MRHSGPSAKHCPLCKSNIGRAITSDLERDLALSLMNKRHQQTISRRIMNEEMRGIGLKKNRYDGHWE